MIACTFGTPLQFLCGEKLLFSFETNSKRFYSSSKEETSMDETSLNSIDNDTELEMVSATVLTI